MNELRRYRLEYAVKSAKNNGCIHVYLDNSRNSQKSFGSSDRSVKKVTEPKLNKVMIRKIFPKGLRKYEN